MQIVVIYDSKFGNTEKIAKAIGRGAGTLGGVRIMSTAEAVSDVQSLAQQPDLLLLGGPTQKRGASPALRAFVDRLPARFMGGVRAASFDTRYRGATWIMGSAAAEVAKAIRKAGGEMVSPPESFFIVRRGPMERQQLEPGEVERAERWARALATAAISMVPAAASN